MLSYFCSLGLLPLRPLRGKLVNWDTLVVDSKSEHREPARCLLRIFIFPNARKTFEPTVAEHQHTPEIEQELGKLAGRKISLTFVPHLLPMIRGILSMIYVSLNNDNISEEIVNIYSRFYRDEKFVRILPGPILPETRNVYASNYCDLSLKWDARNNRLIIISVLDNLVKGAAGQAVQNMNLMLGFKEEQGLETVPLRP